MIEVLVPREDEVFLRTVIEKVQELCVGFCNRDDLVEAVLDAYGEWFANRQ